MQIIRQPLTLNELNKIAQENHGEMAKGVVDLGRKIMALGGELHADAEAVLLKDGSKQEDLWGFNIYPAKPRDQWVEYTSFINIRPSQNNRALKIQDVKLQERVRSVIESLISK
ncbi:MAG: hypothetical protein A2Z88_02185 [Omnitrophica WOR_2 bacterium GWA2_47_8]|nr:MAG: hypothetical protein A2Z88_02185 [Omnitrophica WOR_2 bacterium GWA2_47_8]